MFPVCPTPGREDPMKQSACSALFAALAVLLVLPVPGNAIQDVPHDVALAAVEDDRWTPWTGCWEPLDSSSDANGSELLVCFQPEDGGVGLITLQDGDVVGEEFIVADGSPVAAADGGCEGTRQASWSADDRRVFIQSDLACSEQASRATDGVFALADNGREWIEIHSVRVTDRDPVLAVRHFVEARPATLDRHDVAPAGQERQLAIWTTRSAVSGLISAEALVEATQVVGPSVTAALVAEVGEPYRLDARTLKAASDVGVPDAVLDVMIAVSYPDQFVVEAGEVREAAPTRMATARQTGPLPVGPRSVRSTRLGVGVRCSFWDPFCGSYYYGAGSWGYGYGSGYGYGWGAPGWGWGIYQPRYVVVQPRDRTPRVNPLRGFISPSSASNRARPARPTGSDAAPAASRGVRAIPDRTRPARTTPTTRPSASSSRETRPARPTSGSSRPATTRPTRPPASSGSSSGGRVDPNSGHSSGGSSDRRPTRTSGGS